MLPIRTILCPTDFSRLANYALPMAAALARDYNARLLLVHVVLPDPLPIAGEFGAVPPEPPPDKAALREKLNTFAPSDIAPAPECIVAEGDSATEILRVAEEKKCDLIVMGTHGRTGLGRLLMGSVAEAVTRKAGCPVMTIRMPVSEVSRAPAPKVATAKV